MTKRAKYAAAGLPEYWIVDRHDRVLRRLRLQDGVLVETAVDTPAGIAVPKGSAPRGEGPGVMTAAFAGREVTIDLDYVFAL
jgi:hypothetical protein